MVHIISLIFVSIFFNLPLGVVFCEESMEQELRPPHEGVDICFAQASDLLHRRHNDTASVVVQVCPVSNQLWYYSCCGEHENICCLQLQPMSWLILGILIPIAIGLLALQLLCGVFTKLVKLCCCCCCTRKTEL